MQVGGKFDGKPCAKQPGQKTKPYCRDADVRKNMSKNEKQKRVLQKRKIDPDPNRKGKAVFVTQEEKDACYHKVKSRYNIWPSAYACVPTNSSKALTKTGWKFYKDLEIGEEILTFNINKESLEFKPILNLFVYEDAETYVMKKGNTGWVFECTPNHNWVVKHQNIKNRRKKYKNSVNNMSLLTTEEMIKSCNNNSLVVSAEYKGGSNLLLNKIYKYQTNWIEYLLNCSQEQRQSWLYSAIIYDGNQIKTQRMTLQKNQPIQEYVYDTPHGKQTFGFKQKDINHRDAFLLSAFLNKGIVTFKKHKNRDIYCCHYIAYNGTKSLQNIKIVEKRKTKVWCPQTENNTWVMFQETNGNGIITITGNSGALVKCRKVGVKNWGKNLKEESTKDRIKMMHKVYRNQRLAKEKNEGKPIAKSYGGKNTPRQERRKIRKELRDF